MRYLEVPPHPTLANHVRCYWFLDGAPASSGPGAPPDPVLPDGRPELVFNLGDPTLHHPADGPARRQPAIALVGQITGPFLFEPCGRVHYVGVRFTPAGAHALFGVPMHEITDDYVDAGAIWAGVEELAARLLEAPSAVRRAAHLDAALLNRLVRRRDGVTPAALAARLIDAASGNLAIDRLAGAVGLSGRQLARRFRMEVGIGPKRLSRIARVQAVLRRVTGRDAKSLAHAAVECGYHDQAHMVRDFRELVGASPTAFLARQHPLADFFTDARLSRDG